jgi:hypothetical protein
MSDEKSFDPVNQFWHRPRPVIATSCKVCAKDTCNCPPCLSLKGGKSDLCFTCFRLQKFLEENQ